ncbi:MAG: hypothetical protein H6601_06690 [Flavobacteriales bacterium]|nr:hypothetical protein [Flavobacteriales bacterium]
MDLLSGLQEVVVRPADRFERNREDVEKLMTLIPVDETLDQNLIIYIGFDKGVEVPSEITCHWFDGRFESYSSKAVLARNDIIFRDDNYWEMDDQRLHGTTIFPGFRNVNVRYIGFTLKQNSPEMSVVVEVWKGFVYQVHSDFLTASFMLENRRRNHEVGDMFTYNGYEIVVMEIDEVACVAKCGAYQRRK